MFNEDRTIYLFNINFVLFVLSINKLHTVVFGLHTNYSPNVFIFSTSIYVSYLTCEQISTIFSIPQFPCLYFICIGFPLFSIIFVIMLFRIFLGLPLSSLKCVQLPCIFSQTSSRSFFVCVPPIRSIVFPYYILTYARIFQYIRDFFVFLILSLVVILLFILRKYCISRPACFSLYNTQDSHLYYVSTDLQMVLNTVI